MMVVERGYICVFTRDVHLDGGVFRACSSCVHVPASAKRKAGERDVPPGLSTTTTDVAQVTDEQEHRSTKRDEVTARFTVIGRPVPFARPRFNKKRSFDDPGYAAAKTYIGLLGRRHAPRGVLFLHRPCSLELSFVFARATTRTAKSFDAVHHTQVPDVDNLAKTVLDALNGIWWRDDRYVFRVSAEKRWGDRALSVITARWE